MFSRSPKRKAQAQSPSSHKSVIVDILRQIIDVVKLPWGPLVIISLMVQRLRTFLIEEVYPLQ